MLLLLDLDFSVKIFLRICIALLGGGWRGILTKPNGRAGLLRGGLLGSGQDADHGGVQQVEGYVGGKGCEGAGGAWAGFWGPAARY